MPLDMGELFADEGREVAAASMAVSEVSVGKRVAMAAGRS